MLVFAPKWMELETKIFLCVVIQIQKDEHGMYSFRSGYWL